MIYNPDIHHRQSIRLKGYDYTKEGTYFISICTHNRENIFGKIVDGTMVLSEFGIIVENTWFDLPNHNSNIILDAFIIMPNHVHAIIIVGAGSKPAQDYVFQSNCVGLEYRAGLEPAPTKKIPLYEIVRQFKTFSSKRINKKRNAIGVPVWQRNYYEHIIRNEMEYQKIWEYINTNPLKWQEDKYFV